MHLLLRLIVLQQALLRSGRVLLLPQQYPEILQLFLLLLDLVLQVFFFGFVLGLLLGQLRHLGFETLSNSG